MLLEENVSKIFDTAKEKGLENVEIRINQESEKNEKAEIGIVELWVNGKDRFSCNSLAELQESLEDHEDLKWMN